MRIIVFTSSLISDWGGSWVPFLRGVVTEWTAAGHRVTAYEPADATGLSELFGPDGEGALAAFRQAYPLVKVVRYAPNLLDLDSVLLGADAVVMHENQRAVLGSRLRRHRCSPRGHYDLLLFDPGPLSSDNATAMAHGDCQGFDAALVASTACREAYRLAGWESEIVVWPTAADIRKCPRLTFTNDGRGPDLTWIGDWEAGSYFQDLRDYLLPTVRVLGLRAYSYGASFPTSALVALKAGGIDHQPRSPNGAWSEGYANAPVTIHLAGRKKSAPSPCVPAPQLFPALACGLTVVSAPWDDRDGLLSAGRDYLVAGSKDEFRKLLQKVLQDRSFAQQLGEHGRSTVLARHTCQQRAEALVRFLKQRLASATTAG